MHRDFQKSEARLWTWITLPPSLSQRFFTLLFKSSNDSLQFSAANLSFFFFFFFNLQLHPIAMANLHLPDSSSNHAYCRKQKSLGLLCSKFASLFLLFDYLFILVCIFLTYYLFSLVVFWHCMIEMMFTRSASTMPPLGWVTLFFLTVFCFGT